MVNVNSAIGMLKTVGANAAKKIKTATFNGTKQTLNGKTIVKGTMPGDWGSTVHYTSITSGNKRVSRSIPCGKVGIVGDKTKIITHDKAKVGDKEVRTFNREQFIYDDAGNINHCNETIDSVFAGRKLLGKRKVISNSLSYPDRCLSKTFKDAQGNILKRVYYIPKTGKRTYAEFPDGSYLRYNEKGLPVFTDAHKCQRMDLGGLDTLF